MSMFIYLLNMSLRHLIRDLNSLGVYSDVYMSMGGTDINNGPIDMGGTIVSKYPMIQWTFRIPWGERYMLLKLESPFSKFIVEKYLYENSSICYKLWNGDEAYVVLLKCSGQYDGMAYIMYNRYKIKSDKDLERYVNEWLEKK